MKTLDKLLILLNFKLESEEDWQDFKTFLLPLILTVLWCVSIYNEAFGHNQPGHTITYDVTLIMLTAISGYTGRKVVARQDDCNPSGKGWGKTLGGSVVIYGYVLWFLYHRYFPDMIIPEQLWVGIGGIFLNIFGWEYAKVYIRRKNNGKNNNSG